MVDGVLTTLAEVGQAGSSLEAYSMVQTRTQYADGTSAPCRTPTGCAEPEAAGERVVWQRGRGRGSGCRLQLARPGRADQERPGNGRYGKIVPWLLRCSDVQGFVVWRACCLVVSGVFSVGVDFFPLDGVVTLLAGERSRASAGKLVTER